VSQPNSEALPASPSDVDVGCRHSEVPPAVQLVLSVLQVPGDWLELRRSHTQEVPDKESGQKKVCLENTF
jgi:hypothetical protein